MYNSEIFNYISKHMEFKKAYLTPEVHEVDFVVESIICGSDDPQIIPTNPFEGFDETIW